MIEYWYTDELHKLFNKARNLVENFLKIKLPEVKVYISTEEYLVEILTDIYVKKGYTKKKAQKMAVKQAKFIRGLYIRKKKTIFLKEDVGENLQTLVHELLHVVQKCDKSPIRKEKIVIFLTYLILKDRFEHDHLTRKIVEEWQRKISNKSAEIVKRRLLQEGDCNNI